MPFVRAVIVHCENANRIGHESILRILATSVGGLASESLVYASEAGIVNSSSVPESSSLQNEPTAG